MPNRRQAIMIVSRQCMESLLPPGRVVDCVADKLGVSYEWLVEAMKFPEGTRITGVSLSLRFEHDQIALRIESPCFVETEEAQLLPEVEAFYGKDENGNVRFLEWDGPAVQKVSASSPLKEEWKQQIDDLAKTSSAGSVKFREFL